MKKVIAVIMLLLVSVAIAVECVRPPEITGPPSPYPIYQHVTVKVGELYYRQEQPCDPDGDPIVMSVVSLPMGCVFDPNTLRTRWTPTKADIGDNLLEYSVVDVPPVGEPQMGGTCVIWVTVLRGNNSPFLLPNVPCSE